MSWSDPIADMLTRIRNAQSAGLKTVDMPGSRLKGEVARVMKAEGYIADFVLTNGTARSLRLTLKYTPSLDPVIRGLKRESRPGLRKFFRWAEIPRVLGGSGTAVVSTSGGVMSGQDARKRRLGGELICTIW